MVIPCLICIHTIGSMEGSGDCNGDISMNELVANRLKDKPAKNGYHPNVAPYKVIVHPYNGESYIKREYTTREKAENYAVRLSLKNKRLKITVECIRV